MSAPEAEGREGPDVSLKANCGGCKYLRSDFYTAQGDSGFDHVCTHSSRPRDLDSRTTPEWCPFIERATLVKIGQITGTKYEVKGSDDRYARLNAAVRSWRAGEFPAGEPGDTELWSRADDIAKEQR